MRRDMESYILKWFAFGCEVGYFLEHRRIPMPSELRFTRERRRFVVPTEFVIRDLTPRIPEIGNAIGTNLVSKRGDVMTTEEARKRILEVANIVGPKEPECMSERNDAYYDLRDKVSDVHQAINRTIWDDALWAVELWLPCGDDGHVEYEMRGYALVRHDDVTDFVHAMVGRYGEEATFV